MSMRQLSLIIMLCSLTLSTHHPENHKLALAICINNSAGSLGVKVALDSGAQCSINTKLIPEELNDDNHKPG